MNERILIIGMGNLMTLIAPSYTELLGDRLATDLVATTVDEEDRKKRQELFPFRIQLGNNPGALRSLRPTIILFAPPPEIAAQLAQDEIAPYYAEVRENMDALPILLATPPVPAVDKYLEILGEDAPIATLLPNTFTQIAGKKVEKEGMSMVTMSPVHPLSEEAKTRVLALLAPLGEVLFSMPQYTLKTLTAGVVLTALGRMALDLSENLPGAPAPGKVAEAIRYAHRRVFAITYGSDEPAGDALPQAQMKAMERFHKAYTDGVLQYMEEAEDPDTAVVSVMGDMNLHTVMMQTKEQTGQSLAQMATKGGMLEKALLEYEAILKNDLMKEASALADAEAFSEAFLEEVKEYARATCHAVLSHTLGLSK